MPPVVPNQEVGWRPAVSVQLRICVEPARVDELRSFLREAIPFYESTGGIHARQPLLLRQGRTTSGGRHTRTRTSPPCSTAQDGSTRHAMSSSARSRSGSGRAAFPERTGSVRRSTPWGEPRSNDGRSASGGGAAGRSGGGPTRREARDLRLQRAPLAAHGQRGPSARPKRAQ